MNRTIKTIQRDRPKKNDNSVNENHINIDINMADKEKEHIKEVVQEVLPVLIKPASNTTTTNASTNKSTTNIIINSTDIA